MVASVIIMRLMYIIGLLLLLAFVWRVSLQALDPAADEHTGARRHRSAPYSQQVTALPH